MHDKNYLGSTVRDVITGFEGVVIGHVVYLTGCNQTLVQPRAKDKDSRPQSEWFDDSRMQLVAGARVELPRAAAEPGCDRAAPHR